MVKKPSKSTRRARAKKEQAPTTKKKTIETPKAVPTPEVPVIIAESSDEPVVEKQPTPATVPIVESAAIEQAAEEIILPSKRRMIASACALAVLVVALIFGAAIIRQQNERQAVDPAQSAHSSSSADKILQSGGNVCTNQQATSDTTGSTNPQSVGMILQSNPGNSIQTPQTYSSGDSSDAAKLQGASCF